MNAPDAGILKQWRREFHAFPEIGWSEFVTTAKLIERLEGMGFTVLSGTAVINPAFVRGRVESVVEQGLAAARAHGVSEALLQRMEGLTGCVAVFDSGRPVPTLGVRSAPAC